jgi:hypothetical protein
MKIFAGDTKYHDKFKQIQVRHNKHYIKVPGVLLNKFISLFNVTSQKLCYFENSQIYQNSNKTITLSRGSGTG